MPTYSYECAKCGSVTDAFHAMSASPKVACGDCGSKRTKKLLGTGAGIIFKGSGFYETDYKNNGKKPKSAECKGESKSETKSDSKSESASSTTKESKPKSKASAA